MLSRNIKPYGIAIVAFLVLAIIINYLAVTNTLAHDKLNVELFLLKSGNQNLFPNDAFLQGNAWHFFYVPFVEFMRFANQFTGSSEETWRLLVPITFFLFWFAMFIFLYHFTRRTFISITIAILSSIYIPEVLHETWGIPGPSMIMYRHPALALLPFSFLLFFKYFKTPRLPFAFFLTGLIGIIHPVSALWLTLIFLGALFFNGGFNGKTIKQIFLCGLASIIGVSPFLFWHFILFPPDAGGGLTLSASPIYFEAFWTSQSHMSPVGMATLYQRLFVEKWYTIWPLILVFWLTLRLRKKKTDETTEPADSISRSLVISTFAVTFSISIIQQILQIAFKIPPLLMEEPRAFKFIYFILYLYLAILLTEAWPRIHKNLLFKRKKTIWAAISVTTVLLAGIIIFMASDKISRISSLVERGRNDPEIGNTCRNPMYGWMRKNTPLESIFLIDPNRYPPFRICAQRGVVYHYRDGAAVAPSSNMLIEWFLRKQAVEAAYEKNKDGQEIFELAVQYKANYIVSEKCVAIPGLETIYSDSEFDCVYKIK